MGLGFNNQNNWVNDLVGFYAYMCFLLWTSATTCPTPPAKWTSEATSARRPSHWHNVHGAPTTKHDREWGCSNDRPLLRDGNTRYGASKALDGGLNIAQKGAATDACDIYSLQAILTIDNVKVHIFALLKGLIKAIEGLDARVMHKDVFPFVCTRLDGKEPITINIIEPLALANIFSNLGLIIHFIDN